MEENRAEYPAQKITKKENKVENEMLGKTFNTNLDVEKYEADLDEEVASTSMFHQYVINNKIYDVFEKEPLIGVITKIAAFKGEELVLRTKILRWTKDVRLKRQGDKEFLEFIFRCNEKNIPAIMGKQIGNKSGKPYWGISYNFGKGDFINYAFNHDDMKILCRLSIFRKVENDKTI